MNISQFDIAKGKNINRAALLTILQIALQAGESRFVRNISEEWLNAYPYDLHVEYLRAKALIQQGKRKKALQILIRITDLDPEFLQAHEVLAQLSRRIKADLAENARSAVTILQKSSAVPNDIATWAQHLVRAHKALDKNELEQAEGQVQAALMAQPSSPLPAITHLRLARAQGLSWLAIDKLIELYRSQWPKALNFKLMDAEKMMESGQEDEAVELLHESAAEDVSGQVAKRLWGQQSRFKSLWSSELSMAISQPIPASVSAGLGWNHLESGLTPVTEKRAVMVNSIKKKSKENNILLDKNRVDLLDDIPETPLDLEAITTQTENDLNLRADHRTPSYVMLTSKQGLINQYGEAGFNDIDASLRHLLTTTSALPHWDACLIYVDDAQSLKRFNLSPVNANDAWEIKNLITDLDEALRDQSEMIGAMLIVGGPEVLPFHHLPNPVDDDDKDVPSDNPYASIDENYFIPTWPIGRLPGGSKNKPSDLIKSIQKIAANRITDNGSIVPMQSAISRLMALFGIAKRKNRSFGYTAEIWRRASNSVYRPIGEPRKLSISPPAESGKLPKEATLPLELAYFNLHGLEESGDWYGQRDPIERTEGPDYPIALSPKDIVNSGRAPQIVFSEACFGANIINKSVEDAIALKFLASGSKAVVGSTCTSYGSITTPLIAADLLGQTFWKLLNEGHPAGEALRRAKIALAKSMHRRQGYLDGEDQKTLISFILYGDPLAQAQSQDTLPKRILRPENASPQINTICDKSDMGFIPPQELSEETMATVKSVVSKYLPGMAESQILLSHEHTDCEGHDCANDHSSAKAFPEMAPDRHVITLSKHFPVNGQQHASYARITMDSHGKVVKLAVSR